MTASTDLRQIRRVLSRVRYAPNGGAVVPISVALALQGVEFSHPISNVDARGVTLSRRFEGTSVRPFVTPDGSLSDERALLRHVALHVAGSAAHEALEWLRVDGGLIVDPHVQPVMIAFGNAAP